jgi:hypothetical protein
MKKVFSSYFTPSPEFFKELWEKSLFALDTNVLLDLYRYSDNTRKDLFETFNSLEDRIWIPYQVGIEFVRNRPEVILAQIQMYQKANEFINSIRDEVKNKIETNLNFRIHPLLNREDFHDSLESVLNNLSEKVKKYQGSHPNFFENDPVLDSITKLFENRVGPPYKEERINEIIKTGKARYDKSIPPGYADNKGANKKDGDAVYGDLILWFQLIDRAKELKKPLIFVSNDLKADWWWKIQGKTLGCRPELREEFLRETGQNFYMYTSTRFLTYAHEYLKLKVSDDSITEVETIRKEDQQRHVRFTYDYLKDFNNKITADANKYQNLLDKLVISPTQYENIMNQYKNTFDQLTVNPTSYENIMNQYQSTVDQLAINLKPYENLKNLYQSTVDQLAINLKPYENLKNQYQNITGPFFNQSQLGKKIISDNLTPTENNQKSEELHDVEESFEQNDTPSSIDKKFDKDNGNDPIVE